jgi:hypothetical protein
MERYGSGTLPKENFPTATQIIHLYHAREHAVDYLIGQVFSECTAVHSKKSSSSPCSRPSLSPARRRSGSGYPAAC